MRPFGRWLRRTEILSFEEIEQVVRVAATLGVRKIRLSGGEPLLRRNFKELVQRIARVPGVQDLALTTNGWLFAEQARGLHEAGLRRVNFSCDSLDRVNFARITGRDRLDDVLASIRLARALGLTPVKVNSVIIKGVNDHEIEALAAFARREELSLRFIEFMPLDAARVWRKEMVVPAHEILRQVGARFQLVPVPALDASETARRWRFADTGGELGIVSSVTEPFCCRCNRLRLTADGKIRTCLFGVVEHDIRSLLRRSVHDDELRDFLRRVVRTKERGHEIGRPGFQQPSRPMSCIGG